MSIAMIRRGEAHGTRINHQKQNNQRELDVHSQCKCRWQDVLFASLYWREAPIRDCLYKKQLGRFVLKFNILGKKIFAQIEGDCSTDRLCGGSHGTKLQQLNVVPGIHLNRDSDPGIAKQLFLPR
jgi:hypothetical protein